MTDPIVKQVLLDLVDVIRKLTVLVDNMNRRIYDLSDRLDTLQYGGDDE
jgi:hypothetical protein